MKTLKDYISIIEARVDYPEVSYTTEPTKVTAQISGSLSGKYTKLMRNMQRIDVLSEELKALQDEVKQQRREDVAELFNAEDAVLTRVVETKSVVFTLTKDPAVTVSPKYKVILEELEKQLTPELLIVLQKLKEEHVTITQKEPALKYKELGETEQSSNLVKKVFGWLPKFDSKLDAIKKSI